MKLDKSKTRTPPEGLRRKRPEDAASGPGSIFSEDTRPEIKYIIPDKIIPYHKQARLHFDEKELEKLADTIKRHGIRQPLTVINSPLEEGMFEVVSGERRLRAARLAGLHQIPCIFLRDPGTADEVALIENLQRKDLHPIELGLAYRNLLDKKICNTQQEIADMLGVQRTHVVEMVAGASLPQYIQKFFLDNNIRNRDLLREALKIEKPEMTAENEKDYQDLQTFLARILEKDKKNNHQRLKKKNNLIVGIYCDEGTVVVTERVAAEKSKDALKALKAELEYLLSLVRLQLGECNLPKA